MGEGVLGERGHVLQRETETWNRWAKGLDASIGTKRIVCFHACFFISFMMVQNIFSPESIS